MASRLFQVPQAGWGQMTGAQRQLIASVSGSARQSTTSRRRSKRSKKAASSAPRSKRAKRSTTSARSSKFTKGSAAARKHMARLRAMRKK